CTRRAGGSSVDDAIVRDSELLTFRGGACENAKHAGLGKLSPDRAGWLAGNTLDLSEITLLDAVPLGLKLLFRLRSLREQQNARRFAIKPMDDIDAGVPSP